MKKILLATIAILALAGTAHASSSTTFLDCGNDQYMGFATFKGKLYVVLEGIDGYGDKTDEVAEKDTHADDFIYRVRLHNKVVIFRYWWDKQEGTLGGHACKFLSNGDPLPDDVLKRKKEKERK